MLTCTPLAVMMHLVIFSRLENTNEYVHAVYSMHALYQS